MIIGILKERKAGEYRAAMTPAGVEIMKQTVLSPGPVQRLFVCAT